MEGGTALPEEGWPSRRLKGMGVTGYRAAHALRSGHWRSH